MGALEDSLYAITSVFSAALVLVIGYYVVSQLITFPQFNTATAQAVQTNLTYLDGLIAFGVVLLFVGSMILAYFLPSHPVFFISFILNAFVALIISPVYSNLYATLAKTPLLNPSFELFPLTALMIGNLPLITLVLSALLAIVSYGKKLSGQAPMGEFG